MNDEDEPSSDKGDSAVIPLNRNSRPGGFSRVPETAMIALPPHLAFLIHRDAARDSVPFQGKLNAMLIEYLEAYYEDELVALDDEQLQLFGLGHITVGKVPGKDS